MLTSKSAAGALIDLADSVLHLAEGKIAPYRPAAAARSLTGRRRSSGRCRAGGR